jgi:hypothetical protein
MVGKAAVWGHFGSWDFRRADMYQSVVNKPYNEGINILKEEFNLSDSEADTYYTEIQSTEGDKWISPWPGYMTGEANCAVKGDIATCENGVEINLKDYSTTLSTQGGKATPASIVYAAKKDLVEKKFDNSNVPYSVILIPNGDSFKSVICDPLLAKSMFTRLFYFNGHGSQHFKKFSDVTTFNGERIIVWTVNWKPDEINVIDEMKDRYTVNYIGWLNNGTIFDSSINGWQSLNITKSSELDEFENSGLTFAPELDDMLRSFEDTVLSMKLNDTKTIKIKPEDAYGTDPAAHPLGNKTLNFKIKLVNIK